jgi:putative spermidine/putrescine transport system permease protein
MRTAQTWIGRLVIGAVYFAILLPVLFVLLYSVNTSMFFTLPMKGFTLKWYHQALFDGRFSEGLVVSAQVALASTVISLVCGTSAALALVRGRLPYKEAISQLLLSPLILPAIPLGIGLSIFFTRATVITGYRISGTFITLVLGHAVISMPWVMRMVLAGMETLDLSAEEAAQNLGASPWRTAWHVTLPLLKPSMIAGAIFAFITSFSDATVSLFLVGPSMTTLPISILNYIAFRTDPSVAAISSIVILLTVGIMVIMDRIVGINKVW